MQEGTARFCAVPLERKVRLIFKESMMMIDDEYLAAEIENALGIIECAFQNAIDNTDSSELEDEIKRGISEILAAQDKVMGILGEA